MTSCLLRFIDLSIYQSIPILSIDYSGYWDSGWLVRGKKKPGGGDAIKGKRSKVAKGERDSSGQMCLAKVLK